MVSIKLYLATFEYSSIQHIRNIVFNLRSDLFLIKMRYNLKIRIKFLEFLIRKIMFANDCHTKHTVLASFACKILVFI